MRRFRKIFVGIEEIENLVSFVLVFGSKHAKLQFVFTLEPGETSRTTFVSHGCVPMCTTAFAALLDLAETLGNIKGWWSQRDAPGEPILQINSMPYVAAEDRCVLRMCTKNREFPRSAWCLHEQTALSRTQSPGARRPLRAFLCCSHIAPIHKRLFAFGAMFESGGHKFSGFDVTTDHYPLNDCRQREDCDSRDGSFDHAIRSTSSKRPSLW